MSFDYQHWVTVQRVRHFVDMYRFYKKCGRADVAWSYLHMALYNRAYFYCPTPGAAELAAPSNSSGAAQNANPLT